jgi:hypothetical protein
MFDNVIVLGFWTYGTFYEKISKINKENKEGKDSNELESKNQCLK